MIDRFFNEHPDRQVEVAKIPEKSENSMYVINEADHSDLEHSPRP